MMKQEKLLLAGFAAATLVFSAPVLAQQVKFAADAEFYSLDDSGCISSHVVLFVRNGKTNESKESARAKVQMTALQIDECLDQVLLEARAKANLKDGEVSFDPQLDEVTLDATIQVQDAASKNPFDATVSVNWVAVDEPVTLDVNFEVEAPGRIEKRARAVATNLRSAEASGTISLDGGTNLIPDPATDAAITSAR
jgi:hypothetical protein